MDEADDCSVVADAESEVACVSPCVTAGFEVLAEGVSVDMPESAVTTTGSGNVVMVACTLPEVFAYLGTRRCAWLVVILLKSRRMRGFLWGICEVCRARLGR